MISGFNTILLSVESPVILLHEQDASDAMHTAAGWRLYLALCFGGLENR